MVVTTFSLRFFAISKLLDLGDGGTKIDLQPREASEIVYFITKIREIYEKILL